ncbi:THAP domain-containing protein 3 [Suncus etruscus]|uniref:THAP domain-containing protein 3 n=1 Tax=Suncus etruscus TaxID=109475 RepID=UPI00210FBE80|nr:THAP domain-containing protein 3 [Suncus etruscus]XP_049631351.1 THAP domain-containing protein 3 [Suncus etruscus]
MPKSCAARQCCNRYSSRRKQLTFHRFPLSRPELLREWVHNMGRGNFQPKQHTVLCSEHFRPECFSAFRNRKNLTHNAVPTEFAFQHPAPVSRPEPGEVTCAGRVGSQLARESAERTSQGRKATPEEGQVLPMNPEAPAPRRGPPPPPPPPPPCDHSYALRDLDTLKDKLLVALKENEKLRRRVRAQRLVLRRLSRRLRAHARSQAMGAGSEPASTPGEPPSCAESTPEQITAPQ